MTNHFTQQGAGSDSHRSITCAIDMLLVNGLRHFFGLKSPAGVNPEAPRRMLIRFSSPAELMLMPEAIDGRRRSGASEGASCEISDSPGEVTSRLAADGGVTVPSRVVGAPPTPCSKSTCLLDVVRTADDSPVGSAPSCSSRASSSTSQRPICFLSSRY